MTNSPNNGLNIEESPQKLTIVKKWQHSSSTLFLLAGLIMAGFCSFLVLSSLENLLFNNSFKVAKLMAFAFLLFPLFFALFGFLLSYVAFSTFVNKTTIRIEGDLVQIESGPLPLLKAKQIPTTALKQIFVRSALGLTKSFQLSYIDKEDRAQSLLGSFLSFNLPDFNLWEAKEIERRLESFLGISNQAILGEELLAETTKVAGESYPGQAESGNENSAATAILACPESLFFEETRDGFYIFKKWRSPAIAFYTIVAIFLNVGSWVFAISSIQTSIDKGGESYLMALFAIPFMIWGIWMLRIVLAMILNTSTFHISHKELVLSSSPIKVFRNYTIPLNEIIAIEVLTKTRSTKSSTTYYKVLALNLSQGRQIEVYHNSIMMLSDEEVIYLQEKLKRKLGLS